MTVGKIAVSAAGVVMAIARPSALPFAMSATVAGGLHQYSREHSLSLEVESST